MEIRSEEESETEAAESIMSSLLEISGCQDDARRGDVVFVHGLMGDPRKTWEVAEAGMPPTFWPEWIGQEIPEVGVWSLGYEASASDWLGTSMPLIDRATNVLDLLDANDVGDRPIVFVVHSMGGLVVKQLLRASWEADESNPISRIVKRTKGIVFFATPNTGSSLANYLDALRILLLPSKSASDLKRNEPYLRDLNTWFRNNARALGLKLKVYSETQKMKGVLVVDQVSSDPGIEGVTAVPFDSDHADICKLDDKSDLRFKQTMRLIRECLAPNGPVKSGGKSTSLDKVTVDIGVLDKPIRSSPHMESYSDSCTLHYSARRTEGEKPESASIEIVPRMGYLDVLEAGGPIPQLNYFRNPFLCQFPNLDLTVVNNGGETLVLTEALFEVERSRPDSSPIIVFNNKNYHMKLNIYNEGWGEVANVLLTFNILPTGQPFQFDPPVDHLPNCPPYLHSLHTENFALHTEVSLEELFATLGVDVEAIKNAQYYPRLGAAMEARMRGLDPEIAQRLACFPQDVSPKQYQPFEDGYAVLVGLMEFDCLNPEGILERRSVKFSAKVFLFMPPLLAPMPPSGQYNVMLEVGANDYQVSCPVQHSLMPGEPDRFNIRVAAEMSSVHKFRVRFFFNGGRSILSPQILLRHVVPRTWSRVNSRQKTIEETAVEETVNYPSGPSTLGCVTAGLDMMEGYLSALHRRSSEERPS